MPILVPTPLLPCIAFLPLAKDNMKNGIIDGNEGTRSNVTDIVHRTKPNMFTGSSERVVLSVGEEECSTEVLTETSQPQSVTAILR